MQISSQLDGFLVVKNCKIPKQEEQFQKEYLVVYILDRSKNFKASII